MNYRLLFTVLLSLGSLTCLAHDRWILPSHTILSGENQSITLIASVSNDMFHADRPFGDNGKGSVPPSLERFFKTLSSEIIFPDGQISNSNPWQAFARFSTADLSLTDSGTYRISLIQPDSYMTTFRKADGSPGRAFGKDAELPEGATGVVRRLTNSRVEAFVTLNSPTPNALKPTGVGLEIAGDTHPNDLFAGETASFQLYFDGKPLTQKTEVSLVRGGTRHRNQRESLKIATDEQGRFQVTLPQAGFYLLQAEASFPGEPGSGIDTRNAGLFLTLEAFPE